MTDTVQDEFERWAILPPALNLEKDGDGDYEDLKTCLLFDAFCYGYKRGAFNGAAEMQKLCDIDYDKVASYDELMRDRKVVP